MRSLKYIKSGLSCLFAYQSRQSIVWAMELAINTIWSGLVRLFDGASPGPREACLWVLVQCVTPKVSRVIIKWSLNEINAMQVTKWAEAHWAKTTTRLPAKNNMIGKLNIKV